MFLKLINYELPKNTLKQHGLESRSKAPSLRVYEDF